MVPLPVSTHTSYRSNIFPVIMTEMSECGTVTCILLDSEVQFGASSRLPVAILVLWIVARFKLIHCLKLGLYSSDNYIIARFVHFQ